MKRLILPVAALSLMAVLLLSSSGSAESPIVRGRTEQVTITVNPTSDATRPYTFATSGKIVGPPKTCAPGTLPTQTANCTPVVCPPGVKVAEYCLTPGLGSICRGTVTVVFQRGRRTVSARNTPLRPDCTYRSVVVFGDEDAPTGRLGVRARFGGNAVLKPKLSAVASVTAG